MTASATSPVVPCSGAGSCGAMPAERTIWVLDPLTRKLRVPISLLAPSQATVATGTVPSLCMAFLESRCRHTWCRQAHVFPSHIADLRRQALNAPTCCSCHNDPHDTTVLTSRYTHVTVADMPQLTEPIPSSRIALTVGLQRFLTQISATPAGPTSAKPTDVLEIPSRLVCRLHLSHRCRYVEDCNNVHICREYELLLNPPAQLLPALCGISPSSKIVAINDAHFTVTVLAEGDVSDEVFQEMCEAQQKIVQQQPFAFTNNSNSNAAVTPCVQPAAPPPPPPPLQPPAYSVVATSGGHSNSSFLVSAHHDSIANNSDYLVSPLLLSSSLTGASTPSRMQFSNSTAAPSSSVQQQQQYFQQNSTTPVGSTFATPTIGPQAAAPPAGSLHYRTNLGSSPPLPAAIPVEAFSNNSSFLGSSLTGLPPPPPPPPSLANSTTSLLCGGVSPLPRAPPAYAAALHGDLMLPPAAMTTPIRTSQQVSAQTPPSTTASKPLLLRTSVLRVYDVRQQKHPHSTVPPASPSPQRDREFGNTSHMSTQSAGLSSGYPSRDTSVTL